jgi:tetratricopeptide (TPR) repeat protein
LITGLFNVLALLYIGRAVLLAIQIVRDWTVIRQEPLTREKQRLSEQAAFFLGVPPAVLVHEAAHALAVVLFGGRVAEFGYRVFWGYVVPVGSFTAIENWIIAIAGTLGSLAFGGLLWLVLRRNESRTVQYFGLRAFRFQIYFSLLYYPIFTLFLPIGDWRTIYDFAATPVLSGATLIVHAALLLLFWRADRAGAFEMVAFDSAAAQKQHQMIQTAAAGGDPTARLRKITELWGGGAQKEARRELDALLTQHPTFAQGYLQRAIIVGGGAHQLNKDAFEAAGKALELGLDGADQRALAHQLRSLYHLERGDGAAARKELDAALTPTAMNDPDEILPIRRAELYQLRAQAYRRQGQYEAAYAEIEQALKLAREMGLESAIHRYAEEKEIIEKHARRTLAGSLPDPPGQ